MDIFFDKLQNPGFFRENRMDAHSDHLTYAPEDTEGDSSFRKSLDGIWRFHYAESFAQAPEDFAALDYDSSAWTEIKVPGHIQLQGYDIPQYVNVQYPWDGREQVEPGKAPVRFNPVASYITGFEVPKAFEGKRVCISFQGVESSFRVWLNGTYVGYSADSFTPSEFDLTPYLINGENKLAVQVYKWYSGSWLEDQDFFRFSGIFRTVYLYAMPQHHIRDVKVNADYDPDCPDTGIIEVILESLAGSGCVSASLFAPDGVLLEEQTVSMAEDSHQGVITFAISGPLLWSAEKPWLYKIRFIVFDSEGKEEEWFVQKVGIRHFAMDGNVMKLNSRRIVFHGVNRHEFSTDGGRIVTEEELRKDLFLMKRHNINAIRLSHYPNSSRIYELAD